MGEAPQDRIPPDPRKAMERRDQPLGPEAQRAQQLKGRTRATSYNDNTVHGHAPSRAKAKRSHKGYRYYYLHFVYPPDEHHAAFTYVS